MSNYSSYDELRLKCSEDTAMTLRKVKEFSFSRCLKHMEELYEKSQKLQHEKKFDSAYIALRRCADIAETIYKNSKFEQFKKTNSGKTFHNAFMNVLNDLDLLDKHLRDNDAALKSEMESLNVSAKKNEFEVPDGKYIKPQELIAFVQQHNAHVLMIDYREQKAKFIHFFESSSKQLAERVSVVQLNPADIPVGTILTMLAKVADVGDRQYLLKPDVFDLIILVYDQKEVNQPFEKLSPNSPTRTIIGALTTYNNLRAPLKRYPLILKGGFDSWNCAYPMHTKSLSVEEYAYSFDDKFQQMLADSKKATALDVAYPQLSSTITTPAHEADRQSLIASAIVPKKRPTKPEHVDLPPPMSKVPSTMMMEEDLASMGLLKDGTRTATSLSAAKSTQLRPRSVGMPQVDRSTKPTAASRSVVGAITSTFADADNGLPLNPTSKMPSDSVAVTPKGVPPILSLPAHSPVIPSESCATAAQRESAGGYDAINGIQPLALGGARGIDGPIRPPTPDRSTKITVGNKDYFHNAYELSIDDIRKQSRSAITQPGYTGLYNMSNTCFMNATLQALFNTPGFSNIFRNKNIVKHINVQNKFGTKGAISGAFSALIDSVWSGKYAAIRPYKFLDNFARFVNASLADRRQHDAQEFQIYLLDALHEDTNRVNNRTPFEQNYNGSDITRQAEDYISRSQKFSSSIVNDFFNLRMVSRLNCTCCNTSSVTFEEMNQISLELPSNSAHYPVTLHDCLNKHFSDIWLDGSSCWNCPTCRSPQVAGRSTRVWTLPSILIVHMKRFSFDGGSFVKNEIDIQFDVHNVNMSKYLHPSAPHQSTTYSLYAVTNHSGQLNSGHYTALVKNLETSEWLKFDDECVSRPNSSSVQSRNAFIMYYTKR